MKNMHKIIIIIAIMTISIAGAFALMENHAHSLNEGSSYNATLLNETLAIDMSDWSYDKKNDIYYQMGLVYCMNPEDPDYESCGIYVPGKYFKATKNADGTYTCKVKSDTKVGNYTSKEAPIVMPVNTPGHSSCTAPTEYNADDVKDYTDAGFIYLNPGCRGKDNAEAPDGVTDLKAAVTYYRFNGDVLPGNVEKIFTFGQSGGGAQSAIMGASGNSDLYNPYLESIQAAMVDKKGNGLSNSIEGAMCWCPITNPDTSDAAYEWNLGQYIRSNNSFTGELSRDLAREYAGYINELGLEDPKGNTLTLEQSENGVYAAGSYYDYMLNVTEESLNLFLNDTTFPYTSSDRDAMDDMPSDNTPSNNRPSDYKTYKTAQDYIDSLNENKKWIKYDAKTNTAEVTSLEGFVKHCKNPFKPIPAFDNLNLTKSENFLFGIDAKDSAHFDKTVSNLLSNNAHKYSKYKDYSKDYATAYRTDLAKKDSQNNSMETRVNMYNPMYYLCDYYDGAGSSDVAKYWRINVGVEDVHTSQSVDVNLYLAVLAKSGPDNVEFNNVWGKGHTEAERSGDSTTNFINWVNNCLK